MEKKSQGLFRVSQGPFMGPFLNGKLYPQFFPIWTKNSQSENPSYWLSSFNFSSILPTRLYVFFQTKAHYMYKEIMLLIT